MTFNIMGFVLASALTRDVEDRAKATQLSLLGGMLGGSPAGLAVIIASAQSAKTAGDSGTPKPGIPTTTGTGTTDPGKPGTTDPGKPGTTTGSGPTPAGHGKPQPTESPTLIEVPDLVGRREAEAVALVRGSGLEPSVVYIATDQAFGKVIDPGTEHTPTFVAPGSTVVVQVSGYVRVPHVMGRTLEEAEKALRARGLRAVFEDTGEDDETEDLVVRHQWPHADRFVRPHTRVELRLGPVRHDDGVTVKETLVVAVQGAEE